MSPTSQNRRSTYCIRVVSSSSATSAYAGAVNDWGVGTGFAPPPRRPRRSASRSAGLNATPFALV